jgi:hypothetical protein
MPDPRWPGPSALKTDHPTLTVHHPAFGVRRSAFEISPLPDERSEIMGGTACRARALTIFSRIHLL